MPAKDPQAQLDYGVDWTAEIRAGDSIIESTWGAEQGIAIEDVSRTGNIAVVLLSGGQAGQLYEITNTIITALSRTDQRTLLVPVRHR